jgi:hypothetical protein
MKALSKRERERERERERNEIAIAQDASAQGFYL